MCSIAEECILVTNTVLEGSVMLHKTGEYHKGKGRCFCQRNSDVGETPEQIG